MNTNQLIVAILITCFSISISAQNGNMVLPKSNQNPTHIIHSSEMKQTPLSAKANPHQIESDWNVILKNYTAISHGEDIPYEEFSKLKKEANDVRNHRDLLNTPSVPANRSVIQEPVIQNNFRGNIRNGSIPMDNTMAVSRNGFIVSSINTNIVFANVDGTITFEKSLADFFVLVNLGTRMFDPRVIYDQESNRFILMCLNGSDPSTTHLAVAFSQTEDPNGEWNYYKFDGNPNEDQNWCDFPNIAVSSKDLYIAGQMFNENGNWQYSVIYQISKTDGYEGKTINWKYFDKIQDVNGSRIFNPVPVQSTWKTLTDPGMYFISNSSGGGTSYNLLYTTGSLSPGNTIVSQRITGFRGSTPPDARQKGTATLLKTGGGRIRTAVYQNGIIHFGMQSNTETGDAGVYYGRMDIANAKVTANVLSTIDKDYSYPTITSFGSTEKDSSFLINYLVSGPNEFPSQAQRICRGTENNFEWSDEVILKKGLSVVGTSADTTYRWGDYTAASRRFFDDRVESWVVGCFGETRSWATWIGQMFLDEEYTTIPMAEFMADKTTTKKGTDINFTDLTKNNASEWYWQFENGNPSTSTLEKPVVTWSENGAYDVLLIVKNDLGNDTIVKSDYIHIKDPIVKPSADFSQDRDTIFVDEDVQFINQSTSNSVNYKWTFQSGIPSYSTDKEPIINYNKAGSFLVSLTASNIAGTNTKIKVKSIVVKNRSIPITDFISDKKVIGIGDSISFTDLTSGGPISWNWSFPGGTPASSSLQNQIVKYNTEGVYDVTLNAKNEHGENIATKTSFIIVGMVGTQEIGFINDIKLYPNPVTNSSLTIRFENQTSQLLQFDLFSNDGRNVKTLYNDKVKAGLNDLSFQTNSLNPGNYYIRVTDRNNKFITVPFILIQ